MSNQQDLMPKDTEIVFMLGHIPLLPDYLYTDTYVQPGHTRTTPKPTFTAKQLQALGAKPVKDSLWIRHHHAK